MTHPEAPGAVRWIVRTLEEAGYETWAVGGAVRDALAGIPSGDWDLTTRATPNQVRRLFRRTVPLGVDHGTVGVLARDGTLYEVTTFRQDVETTGRHAVVSFAETLDEDLARRDFTINAVAWHPIRNVFHDPYGGRKDLEEGLIRTVGPPEERFGEDYLRVLRALRFAGRFRFDLDGPTWIALCAAVGRMGILSPERVREELEKTLGGGGRPSAALSLYAASGALSFLYPELVPAVGRVATGSDEWSLVLRAVDLLPPEPVGLRMAALLSAAGTVRDGTGMVGPGDREATAMAAAELLTRIRSSNARVRIVAGWAVAAATAPPYDAEGPELRRWLAAAGREGVPGALRVLAARLRAGIVVLPPAEWPGELREASHLLRRLRAEARGGAPLAVEELALSGRELIRLGYTPGPAFGNLFRTLLEETLDDPEMNRPARLLRRARELLALAGLRPREH
jgi:tRNA nucleotidyltransferase (CCA-adding enzyme)